MASTRLKTRRCKGTVSKSAAGGAYLMNEPPRAQRGRRRSFWWERPEPGMEQRLRADGLRAELARLERTCSESWNRPVDRAELFDWS